MVHICKSDTGFLVATIGKNGEPLSVSEVLTSKANCWKNIRSQMISFKKGLGEMRVQDDCPNKSIVYSVVAVDKPTLYKTRVSDMPSKKYIPK